MDHPLGHGDRPAAERPADRRRAGGVQGAHRPRGEGRLPAVGAVPPRTSSAAASSASRTSAARSTRSPASASPSPPSRGAGRRATAASCGWSRCSTRAASSASRRATTDGGHPLRGRGPYEAPKHFDMRRCGCRAGTSVGRKSFWVGLSHFLPGGGAEMTRPRSRRSTSSSRARSRSRPTTARRSLRQVRLVLPRAERGALDRRTSTNLPALDARRHALPRGRAMKGIEGRSALVTGATGALGEAAARELAELGAKLTLTAGSTTRSSSSARSCATAAPRSSSSTGAPTHPRTPRRWPPRPSTRTAASTSS